MNKFLTVLSVFLMCMLTAIDADAARRLGGGGNFGTQRNMTTQPAAKPPAQQAQPAAPAATPAPIAQPQPSGMSRWLGPLAGLAIGAGLASLFMNNGMAGGLGGILMIALLAAAAMFAWRMLRAKPVGGGLQYASGNAAPIENAGGMPRIGSAIGGTPPEPAPSPSPLNTGAPSRFPPGFDAAQFAQHAKMNFTRLQQANDRRDLSIMRDYMTPQLYAEIAAQIDPMGPLQKTEITTRDANVLEVVTENAQHIASVRFTGAMRDTTDSTLEPFDEIWHLEKPVDGSSGWLIGGIQQL